MPGEVILSKVLLLSSRRIFLMIIKHLQLYNLMQTRLMKFSVFWWSVTEQVLFRV